MKKSDWERAARELLDRERRQLGELPGSDDLLAWSRGESSPEESIRIQEILVHHPEILRVLAEPFPTPQEVRSGVAESLSEEELTQDWDQLQQSILPPARPSSNNPADLPARSLRSWRAAALAAAAMAVIFAGLFFRSHIEVRRLAEAPETPLAAFDRRVLLPDQQRAGSQDPILLSAAADHFLLKPSLTGGRRYPDYRLDLIGLNHPRPERIWSASGLRLQEDQTFEVWIPRAFLRAADYRLEIYGLQAGRAELLATYTVRLAE